jgi:hypothetical protein
MNRMPATSCAAAAARADALDHLGRGDAEHEQRSGDCNGAGDVDDLRLDRQQRAPDRPTAMVAT